MGFKSPVCGLSLALAVKAYCQHFKSYPVASEASLKASLAQAD